LDTTADKNVPIVARVTGKPADGYEVAEVQVEPRVARLLGPASALSAMKSVETDPISLANRAGSFSVPATVIADAPGVRVREGQVVTVTVNLRPVATPVPSPAPRRRVARG